MMVVPPGYVALPGSERKPAKGARRIGGADPSEKVRILIRVHRPVGAPPPPDHQHWIDNKPGQRKFLSRQELGAKYGAAAGDLDQVVEFVRSKGLTVLESNAARRTVAVSGTVTQLNEAFAVDLGKYEIGEETYRGRDGFIYVPEQLTPLVEGVFGLDNRKLARHFSGTNGPTGQQLTPIDVANLYNFPPIPAGIENQTIGLFEFGGGYVQSDIDGYITYLNGKTLYNPPLTLSPISVSSYSIDGSTNGTPDLENALDIEVAGSVANGSPIAVYYTNNTQAGFVEAILTALFPGPSQPSPSVISISYGWTETYTAVFTAATLQAITGAFQVAAEAGVTVFCSSGDDGSNGAVGDGNAHVYYPGCDPWVTSCGGTSITNANWTSNTTASTFSENTWKEPPNANGTDVAITSGGISVSQNAQGKLNFPRPSWQQGVGVPPSINDNTTEGRGIPDIAGQADGYNIWLNSGLGFAWGTSETAPLYAALIARINATLGFNVGYLNPTLYSLAGSSVFRDIADGISNGFTYAPGKTSPDYKSITGWDACTGLGVVNGTQLLEAIAAGAISPAFYFSVSKNNFGLDEISDNISYPEAFSLVLDGVAPNQVLENPVFSGDFFSISGLQIIPSSTTPWPAVELGGSAGTLQRITYSYDIHFSQSSQSAFPSAGSSFQKSLIAIIQTTAPGFQNPPPASVQIELFGGADPYFANVSQQLQNPFYLSQDLRVFTVIPGIDPSPIPGVTAFSANTVRNTYDSGAAFTYVQNVLTTLNQQYNDPLGQDPFTNLLPLTGGLTGDSSVTPYTVDPVTPNLGVYMNYNFAIARVRLNGSGVSANDVSVFFRLFLTASNDTDYQPSTTYDTSTQNGVTTPSISDLNDPLTIPFFATGNYELNNDYGVNVDYETNGVNNKSITVPSKDGLWYYFGCYLNVYNPSNTINGPKGPAINSILTGTHHCLVAQISFADTPIATGISTANCPQLAQRNLQITPSDNPGPPASHRVPQTFDLRPSHSFDSNASNLLNWPDELMIDWGNIPDGSRASIYWPQVSALDVITLASKLYPTHQLTASDAHTLNFACKGQTYIPVPTGNGKNFAGMITVDLPQNIVAGSEFTAVVRRLTTKQATIEAPPPPVPQVRTLAKPSTPTTNWRSVAGSFAITIPVTTPSLLLPAEYDVLAIFKWRLGLTQPTNRWYPVLQRYIAYVQGRISGMGGNPIMIQPSPYGAAGGSPCVGVPPGEHHDHHHRSGKTGKVESLVYDRFGDFDGFTLELEDGRRRHFHSRKAGIEKLVWRVWREQVVVTVHPEHHDPSTPASIILRRPW